MTKDTIVKSKNPLTRIRKILQPHTKQVHTLKDTFLELSKELFSCATFSEYVIPEITSHYIAQRGELLRVKNMELVMTCNNTIVRNSLIVLSL